MSKVSRYKKSEDRLVKLRPNVADIFANISIMFTDAACMSSSSGLVGACLACSPGSLYSWLRLYRKSSELFGAAVRSTHVQPRGPWM